MDVNDAVEKKEVGVEFGGQGRGRQRSWDMWMVAVLAEASRLFRREGSWVLFCYMRRDVTDSGDLGEMADCEGCQW